MITVVDGFCYQCGYDHGDEQHLRVPRPLTPQLYAGLHAIEVLDQLRGARYLERSWLPAEVDLARQLIDGLRFSVDVIEKFGMVDDAGTAGGQL